MKSRRTLAVDADLAEEIKAVAKSRGMSLVSYLRKLFAEALEIERLGYFAPNALRERKIDLMLSRLGFTYLPLDLLESSSSPESAEALGERIGRTLGEMPDVNAVELVERMVLENNVGIVSEDSIVLPPMSGARELVRRLIVGLARGLSLAVARVGDLVVVKVPRYLVSEKP